NWGRSLGAAVERAFLCRRPVSVHSERPGKRRLYYPGFLESADVDAGCNECLRQCRAPDHPQRSSQRELLPSADWAIGRSCGIIWGAYPCPAIMQFWGRWIAAWLEGLGRRTLLAKDAMPSLL